MVYSNLMKELATGFIPINKAISVDLTPFAYIPLAYSDRVSRIPLTYSKRANVSICLLWKDCNFSRRYWEFSAFEVADKRRNKRFCIRLKSLEDSRAWQNAIERSDATLFYPSFVGDSFAVA